MEFIDSDGMQTPLVEGAAAMFLLRNVSTNHRSWRETRCTAPALITASTD